MNEYKIYKLKNGVPFIYIPKNEDLTAIQFGIKVGSNNEPDEFHGASHYLEHMLFKGTEGTPNGRELFNKFYNKGAYINAFTGKESTNFVVKINSKHIEEAINTLTDILSNSVLEQEEYDREKLVIIEEINQGLDEHSRFLLNESYILMFGENRLSKEIAGTPESILSLKREDIFNFYKKFYSANNIYVCISSNISPDIILNYLNNSFLTSLSNTMIEPIQYFPLDQSTPNYKIHEKKLEQIYLNISFPICDKYSNDKYTLDIIKTLLGGTMNSRLFVDLRENNGLSYQISVSNRAYDKYGDFTIFTSFDKKSLYNLHSTELNITLDSLLKDLFTNNLKENKPGALGIIMNNLVRLKSELISEKELEDFKGYMTGSLQIFFDDISNLTDYYVNQLMFFPENVKTIENLINTYNKITINDIQNIAKKYFDFNKLNITILGECHEKELNNYIQHYNK